MLAVMDVFDCVVVGGGPSGAVAAIAAQRAGFSTLLVDAAEHGRDKTCGDGLTPRAVHTLRTLGLEEVLPAYRNQGLKLHGYGGDVTAPWPDSHYGTFGSASPRKLFDAALIDQATAAGATVWTGCAAHDADFDAHGAITAVHTDRGPVRTRWVIVADGVRSPFGKRLGRTWHKDQVYGIAARSYCTARTAKSPGCTRTWSCATRLVRSSRVTGGSSRLATARSTSAAALYLPTPARQK